MPEIWAKSKEKGGGTPVRLSEHIRDALEAFEGLKAKVKDPHLCDLIELAIVCHDWGKVLPAFQLRTLKNLSYKPYYPYHNVPHSLFSVLWINLEKLREKISEKLNSDPRDYMNFVVSAVAYHHWSDKFIELLEAGNPELGELCEELEKNGHLDKLQQNLTEEIKRLSGDWHNLIGFNAQMANGLKNGVPFSEYARPPYQLYWLPKRVEIEDRKRRDWILTSGFLMRSDHFASFCEEENEKYTPEAQNISPDVVKQNIKAKIQEKMGRNEKSLWQLEKFACLKDKNVILVAPTGYGKTEFAFLWSNGEKLIYTLPIRAAVNQIFERAKEIFKDQSSDEKVGLLHSDADVYLLGEGGEAQANLKAYDLARQLAYPVLISTGDQFFPYALRPPGYEKIYATFSYSRLVIDEVQAYDPRAAAIIVKFMEDVIRMGGKFLLMTATLPKFVRDAIDQALGYDKYEVLNLYEEKDKFAQIKKHCLKVQLIDNEVKDNKPSFSIPDANLKEVLGTAIQGKRVLVIANTVKQAQDIFEILAKIIKDDKQYASLSDKLWLLHSRYTLANRKEREAKIMAEFKNPKADDEKEGKILVATQVVEASLDIDADVLFTEIAPLDALVQRMGRVLRRYGPPSEEIPKPNEPNVFIWVFRNGLQSGQHYVYDSDLVLLTLKLMKDLSDGSLREDYKEWLEKLEKNTEQRIVSVVQEIFSVSQTESKPRRRRSKKDAPDDPPSPNTVYEFQVIFSEHDKYDLVERLYDLPEDHSYFKKFRETKEILDAGYMSDRLSEAHKIFREIYTVPIIPIRKKEHFLKEVQEFWERHEDEKRLYTYFKNEVLSEFVVSIPLRSMMIEERNLQSVVLWIRDFPGIEDTQRKRLRRWCQDIYLAKYQYDLVKGIDLSISVDYIDAAII